MLFDNFYIFASTLKLSIMKKLQILKALVDLFWFFSIITIIALIFFIPFMFFTNDLIDVPIKINGQKIVIDSITKKLFLTVIIISYFLFIYGLFLFRKVLALFQKRIVFSDDVILLLDRVGKCFLLSSIISSGSLLLYSISHKPDMSIEFGGGFSSFLFTASLGLFFMVLSEVFKISKTMKDESDFTV